MVICSSIGCNNSSENSHHRITFHRFPQNPQMRNLWILSMRRQNWIPTEYSVLCSAHFKEGDFSQNLGNSILEKKAVPSIFPCFQPSLQPKIHAAQNEEQSRNLEIEKAILFMTEVKDTFREEPEVYQHFLHILSECKSERNVCLRRANWRICKLFKGHPELIAHLNSLLSDEWRIEIQPHEQMETENAVKMETVQKDEQCKKLEMEKVQSFMNEVEITFSDKPQVYHRFLCIVDEYKSRSIDCVHTFREHVLNLFGGHPELIDRISNFLSCEWRIKMELDEQTQEQNSVKHVTTQIKEEHQESESENVSSYANQPCATQMKEQCQESELENASSSHINEVKCESKDELQVYRDFLDLLKEFKKERINTPDVIERASKMLQAHPELVSHFSKTLSCKRKI